MLLFNIVFCVLSIMMVVRGIALLNLCLRHPHPCSQESAITIAIILLHSLTAIRSLLLIEVGPHRIAEAGLLLNYYLFLGSITIQLLASDFVLKFVRNMVNKPVKKVV